MLLNLRRTGSTNKYTGWFISDTVDPNPRSDVLLEHTIFSVAIIVCKQDQCGCFPILSEDEHMPIAIHVDLVTVLHVSDVDTFSPAHMSCVEGDGSAGLPILGVINDTAFL